MVFSGGFRPKADTPASLVLVPRNSRLGQSAGLVVVGLEWVKKTGHRFAHALSIPCRTFAWIVVVVLESISLEGLLAKDREGAVIRIINVVKEHSNCPA